MVNKPTQKSIMAAKAAVDGFTAWSNMRLVRGGCETQDILQNIMSGSIIRVLLEGLYFQRPRSGYCPSHTHTSHNTELVGPTGAKKLGSLEG